MFNTPAIRIELGDDGLALMRLTQPTRGNPMDGDFTRDFRSAMDALWTAHDAQRLRAVLLTADGANFSYGGDIKSLYPAREQLPHMIRAWTGELHMGLQRFWQLPVPVVAAAQGFAMGGGLSLLAGCDVVLAGASAKFGSAFVQIGFSCDSGSSVTLTLRMGVARARRFVMLAQVLGSADACQAGLVDQVVADDQLQAEALAQAQRLASGPTVAYGEIKRLFLRAGASAFTAQLEDEALTLARVSRTADAQEGVAAMAERRKPVFIGR